MIVRTEIMVLYAERGASFAQTPLDANESKQTEYNSQRKENFGTPALASEAIVRSHSEVVPSPDLNSLSNQVSRLHPGIMGYENTFQISENQTLPSFNGDGLNYSEEIDQHPKENIAIFDINEQTQKLSDPCRGIEIFDVEGVYQEPIQQKEQDSLGFVNNFLLTTPHSDENNSTDSLNCPLNYSNSFLNESNPGIQRGSNLDVETQVLSDVNSNFFLNGSNPGIERDSNLDVEAQVLPADVNSNSFLKIFNSVIERSSNLGVETTQTLPGDNTFRPTPSTSLTDEIIEKNLRKNSQPSGKKTNEQDLQILMNLLELPVKKRRGRPPGSKNSNKKSPPLDQVKKAPKRKMIPNPPKMLDSHSGISLQSYPSALPSYSKFSQERSEQTKGYLQQTNGYLPSQSALSQQNAYTQQFLPQHFEFSQHSPFTQQSQFIQQFSSSKSAFSPVASSQSSYSHLLPGPQSAGFSHEFSNPNFSQQPYQNYNYSPQQLPKFSQLSASLKNPPQYLKQSPNVKPQGYGQQPENDQHFQEYKANPANPSKSNQNGYLQPLPDYSEYIAKYSQPQTDYAKQMEYYQNYPQFYEQPSYNGEVKHVQKFPRLHEDYSLTSNQNQVSSQNHQRFSDQNQQVSSQKQENLQKPETYDHHQVYPVRNHQVSSRKQENLQKQQTYDQHQVYPGQNHQVSSQKQQNHQEQQIYDQHQVYPGQNHQVSSQKQENLQKPTYDQHQGYPSQNHQVSSQKQENLQKQQIYDQHQVYPGLNHQVPLQIQIPFQQAPPQYQVPSQNQVPLDCQPIKKKSSYEASHHIAHNRPTPVQNHQVPFPVLKTNNNYQSHYPIQADQFSGYKYPYDRELYEQMKRMAEYEQMIAQNMQFLSGESYPYFPNDPRFLLPMYQNAALNQQALLETYGTDATKFFLPSDTMQGNCINKFSNAAALPVNADGSKFMKFPTNNARKMDAVNYPTTNSTKIDTVSYPTTNNGTKMDAVSYPTTNNGTRMDAVSYPTANNGTRIDAVSYPTTNNGTKMDAVSYPTANNGTKMDAVSYPTTNNGTKMDAVSYPTTNNGTKMDAFNYSAINNSTKIGPENYATSNATNFPKEDNGTNLSTINNTSTATNTTNFPKVVNAVNFLLEESSNFQHPKSTSFLPIQQNSTNPLICLENINSALSAKVEKKISPRPNKSVNTSKINFKKECDQRKQIDKGKNVLPVPNYFQLPNGKRVLSITASSLDQQSKNSEKIQEHNVVTETREWLLKSPPPLEIDCSEVKEIKRRKIFRTEYKPWKDIKHAVKRYRAKGFPTRSPCKKDFPKQSDLDKDDEDDEDDFDDDGEESNELAKEEEKKSDCSQNSQNFQEGNSGEKNSSKNVDCSTKNDETLPENSLPEEEQNLPTALDIITGRWTRKDGFKKSGIYHQGLPNVQWLVRTRTIKTVNHKQTKNFNLENKQIPKEK